MLISCPNCGKTISDTAIECIHCKTTLKNEEIIKSEEKKLISIYDLSEKETEEIDKQFEKEYPEIGKIRTRTSVLSKIFTPCFIVGVILIAIVGLFSDTFNLEESMQTVLGVCAGISLTLGVICFVMSVVANIILQKKWGHVDYEAWLKEKGYYIPEDDEIEPRDW